MVKKTISCFVIVAILFTCVSCKQATPFLIKDYLSELALRSGIGSEHNFDETLNSLINWEVIDQKDILLLNENLDYDFLSKTICHLVQYEGDYLNHLKELGFINHVKEKEIVDKTKAIEVIDKAVNIINNKEFENNFYIKNKDNVKEIADYDYSGINLYTEENLSVGDLIYLESDGVYKKIIGFINNRYVLDDVEFEEVIEQLDLSGSYELDFEEALDIPGGVLEDNTSYVNNGYTLLSSSTKSNNFSTNGYRVSYSIKKSGINARISKKFGVNNVYFDISLTNIKPTYKWDYKDGKVNEAYLKVDYESSESLGVSIGKHQNYIIDTSNKDTSSVMNYLESVVKKRNDEVEATIKICEIKTPIPEMPTVYFNIEVLAKIYATGRAEIVLYNKHLKGLEVKNGELRTINDSQRDVDFKLGGSTRACLGLNFNLQAVDNYLMDIEIDAGVRAALSSTVHIYDSKGEMESIKTDLAYSALDDIAKDNEDIKICGDVSLNWVLDISVNTYRTLLHKFALWTTKSILDEDNQLFNNKTHIENGVFVKSCTRKKRFTSTTTSTNNVSIDKLILSKHNAVVLLNNTYQIEVTNIPSGYKLSDLIYKSLNEKIATVSKGIVYAKNIGACDIEVFTKDGKYKTMINILVSKG